MNLDIKKATDINQIYNSDSGYDTPKRLNRSEEIVPHEILDEIEKGITIETLNQLKYPIFKYRTQITIHGQFDKLSTNSILNNSYKTIFQNQNKSIGIKWNAIDFEKKKTIYSVLKTKGYSITFNSNSFYASKFLSLTQENVDILKAEYEHIDDSLFVGSKNLYSCFIPMYGKFIVLDVCINAILKENVWKLLSGSFDTTEESWNQIQKAKSDKAQQERIEREEYFKNKELKDREELEAKNNELKSEYKVITSISEIPVNDCIMFFLKGHSTFLIKKFTKNGTITYQTMRESSYDKGCDREEINTRLTKFTTTEKRITEILNTSTVFLYKVLGEIIPSKPLNPIYSEDPNPTIPTTLNKPNISIVDYSASSVAVFGNTYEIKGKLSELGGKFNKFLINPDTGKQAAGWIFPKYKRDKLKSLLENNTSRTLKYLVLFENFNVK